MKNLAPLGLVAGLSLSPLTNSAQELSPQEILIKENTNKDLTGVMEVSAQKADTINFSYASRNLVLRKKVQKILESEFADDKDVRLLQKKYGQGFILDQLTTFVAFIEKNPEQF